MRRVAVFEVDHVTSAAKLRAVEARLGSTPRHVRYLPVDFPSGLPGDPDGRRRLRRTSASTLFVWEGVTNYLTEDAVVATLRWCARATAGSTVIFTYLDREVLEEPGRFAARAPRRKPRTPRP
jgi:O-methyltransferase involved in polyketide biosynthesis